MPLLCIGSRNPQIILRTRDAESWMIMMPTRPSQFLGRTALLLGWFCICAGQSSSAQPIWKETRLAEVSVSDNSEYVRSASWGFATLRDASQLSFRDWYGGDGGLDMRLAFLTPLDRKVGILWGFGTGEGGQKYWIDPSLKIGFIARDEISESSDFSIRMTYVIGGYLKEKPCIADYGFIGGTRKVNCRLADSVLRPEDTLSYLFDKPPGDQVELSIMFNMSF